MPTRIALRWLVVAAALWACQEPPLHDVSGHLSCPAEAVFPSAFAGYEASLDVPLRNDGLGPLEVRAETEAPFLLAPAALSLPPAGSATVRVTFLPSAPGDVTGRLLLRSGDESCEVPLRARVAAPPDCQAQAGCEERRFDPAEGRCVRTGSLPDGAACEGPCVVAGVCRQGVCEGSARSCDDGNRCTEDRCDPSAGCAHAPRVCPRLSNPCEAALCDPARGCASAPVADGTRCGPSDCDTERVCRSGRCVARSTPEGAACTPDNVCPGQGVCRARKCVERTKGTLEHLWMYELREGWWLDDLPVVDEDGNVYWTEVNLHSDWPFDELEVASVDQAGMLRYRIHLGRQDRVPAYEGANILPLGDLLVTTLRNNVLEARRREDASPVWTKDMLDVVTGGARQSGGASHAWLGLGPAPVADSDHLFVRAVGSNGSPGIEDFPGQWIVKLRVSTGAVEWVREVPDLMSDLIVDEDGNLYGHTISKDLSTHQLLSWDPRGVERWRRPLDTRGGSSCWLRGVARGRLFCWKWQSAGNIGSFFATTSGALEYQLSLHALPWGVGYEPLPLISDDLGVAIGTPCLEPGDGDCQQQQRIKHVLDRFDPATGARLWRVPLQPITPHPLKLEETQPALTSQRTVVFGSGSWEQDFGPVYALREFDQDGRLVSECSMDQGAREHFNIGATALHGDMWLVTSEPDQKFSPASQNGRIHAFRLPGRSAAKSGWVMSGANAMRTQRAK